MLAGCASKPGSLGTSAERRGIVTVDVGGSEIDVAPIEGWCFASPAQTKDAAQTMGDKLVIYAMFADCDELKTGDTSVDRLKTLSVLTTPKNLVGKDVGNDRTAFVDAVADQLSGLDLTQTFKEAQSAALNELHDTMAALQDAGAKMHISDPISLGVVAHDSSAVYFGMLQRIEVSARSQSIKANIVTLFGVTQLQERAIMLCLQARVIGPSVTDAETPLYEALAHSKAQIARLIALNPDRGLAI
jgi:hypothetical protein